jgi:hypothetical protein
MEIYAIELLATKRMGAAAAELVNAGSTDRIYNAHALIRASLEAVAHAVDRCPGCAAREYRIIADEVEQLIESADEAASAAEHQHPEGMH